MSTPSLLGSDISGITDVDASLSTVGGRLALAQRCLRRLSTKRGSLIGSPLYGFDLQSCIGSMMPVSVVNQRVGEQILLEPEVEDASVASTFDAVTGELVVEIEVVDADGPFDLTLTATNLTLTAIADGVVILPKAA